MEQLTRALFEQIHSEGTSGMVICSGDSEPPIEFHGKKYRPDKTKGFIRFKISHAFPVVTAYGQAIHPRVIAKSFNSLLYQNLNYEHTVIAYDKDNISTDKILGAVVDLHFPTEPVGGWKITEKENAPYIEAVASFAKLARGMDTVVGRHKAGRHKFSVSMEVEYPYKDCGFAIALNGKKPTVGKDFTPDDFLAAGWEYIPWSECDDDLLGCFSMKANAVTKDWKGRKVVQMLGGLDQTVDYNGVAIVHYGAEREAEILQMAASHTDKTIFSILSPLHKISKLLKR